MQELDLVYATRLPPIARSAISRISGAADADWSVWLGFGLKLPKAGLELQHLTRQIPPWFICAGVCLQAPEKFELLDCRCHPNCSATISLRASALHGDVSAAFECGKLVTMLGRMMGRIQRPGRLTGAGAAATNSDCNGPP